MEREVSQEFPDLLRAAPTCKPWSSWTQSTKNVFYLVALFNRRRNRVKKNVPMLELFKVLAPKN